MEAQRTCKRCGTQVSPGAAACPRCMLEMAMQSAAAPPDGPQFVRTDAHVPRPEPPTQDEIAAAFPGVDGLELLGRGGMGVVYKARQKQLERWVALKVLPRALGADPAFRERFLREARALARLRHPNIVAVHEFGESGGLFFLVMELVDGVDLRHVMRERQIAPKEALGIVRDLCDALQFAHDEGVVHRDIKPENVLVDRAGRVKIADFGLAKVIGAGASANLTEAGTVMGTPHYMAPEQLERPAEVDHRADLFALGVVLYEMLTGSLPRGSFEPPSKRIEVDVRLDEIVLKALEREPARRYQQALEVKSDVARVESAPSELASEPIGRREVVARRDPLRGVRGFALCAGFWVVAATLWNFGPFAFWLSFAVLGNVVALMLHGRLKARPALAAALAAAPRAVQWTRVMTSVVWLGLALASIALAHWIHWERGTDAWHPALRGQHGQFEAWRLDPFGFVRTGGGVPGADQDVLVRLVASHTKNAGPEAIDFSAWPMFFVGFLFLALALHVAVRPPAGSPLRREGREVATDVGCYMLASLVFWWIAGPIAALRTDKNLESVERRFTAAEAPDDIARRLSAALSRADLDVDVEQRVSAIDARSAAPIAEAHILRAAAGSPFERWSTSLAGPQRKTPQVWVATVRATGEAETRVVLRAGLYEIGSKLGDEARAALASLETAVRAQ